MFAVFVSMCGCATPPRGYWSNPETEGKPQEDKDYAACRIEGKTATMHLPLLARGREYDSIFGDCMITKGYSFVRN